jgi:hypothetical protein
MTVPTILQVPEQVELRSKTLSSITGCTDLNGKMFRVAAIVCKTINKPPAV